MRELYGCRMAWQGKQRLVDGRPDRRTFNHKVPFMGSRMARRQPFTFAAFFGTSPDAEIAWRETAGFFPGCARYAGSDSRRPVGLHRQLPLTGIQISP